MTPPIKNGMDVTKQARLKMINNRGKLELAMVDGSDVQAYLKEQGWMDGAQVVVLQHAGFVALMDAYYLNACA